MLFSRTSQDAEMLEQAAEHWALPCVQLPSWHQNMRPHMGRLESRLAGECLLTD